MTVTTRVTSRTGRPPRPLRAALAGLVAIAAGLGAVGCDDDGGDGSADEPLSIVVLGDSIASGEGINYGFTYDPQTGTWDGPRRPDPTWEGRHQDCHRSRRAYGDVVAADLGASLTKLACSGASYANGITVPEMYPDADLGPAQFGLYPDGDVNPRYAAAVPDVVVITLGANDVTFHDVVDTCVLQGGSDPTFCTAANPGPDAEKARTQLFPQLKRDYRALIAAIQEQGAEAGKTPRIVFTTYYDPFPAPDMPIEGCADVVSLNRDQLAYLASLLARLDRAIIRLGEIDGVEVADVRDALDGHEYCTDDPWAYGLSIAETDPSSFAPFHPTPAGQRALAAVIAPLVEG